MGMALWKKALALALVAALMLSMQGCGYRELYERLLIHGIGVDAVEDGFLVTVRSSVSPEDEGEECFTSTGKSVLEALTNLSLSTGREPFYSHNYLVVFGETCARQGLDSCLDFFIRYYNTRPAVQVYLAEGSAGEVLSFEKDGKLLRMSELQELGKSGQLNGKAVGAQLLDFVNGVKREGSSAVLPVLRAGKEGVEIASTAYFTGYKQAGALSLSQTRGYMAAKNLLEKGEAVVQGSFGAATLSLSQSKGKIDARIDGDGPVFTISVEAQADISAISGGRSRLGDGEYAQIEKEAAALLEGEVLSALEQSVQEDNCDIFGFGNLLYRQYPAYWRTASAGWHEEMAACRYEVRTSVQVLRLEG